jgi:hypothetical protein
MLASVCPTAPGSKGAHSVAMGEDLEDGDGVGNVGQGGIKVEVGTKLAPDAPGRFGGICTG